MTTTTIATKVTNRTTKDGSPYWESTVTVPGAKPTKLVRKSDGSTQYSTKSAATQACKKFATSVGMTTECESSCATTKAAAKKSPTKKKTASKTASKKKAVAKRSTASCTTKSKRKSR